MFVMAKDERLLVCPFEGRGTNATSRITPWCLYENTSIGQTHPALICVLRRGVPPGF
jgi:hypothetical protein